MSHDYLVTANGFSLGNTASGSYLSQMAAFGGILSFDVLFSGPFFSAINGEASNLVFPRCTATTSASLAQAASILPVTAAPASRWRKAAAASSRSMQ